MSKFEVLPQCEAPTQVDPGSLLPIVKSIRCWRIHLLEKKSFPGLLALRKVKKTEKKGLSKQCCRSCMLPLYLSPRQRSGIERSTDNECVKLPSCTCIKVNFCNRAMRFGRSVGEDSTSTSHLPLRLDGREQQHWVKAAACPKATSKFNMTLFHLPREIKKRQGPNSSRNGIFCLWMTKL